MQTKNVVVMAAVALAVALGVVIARVGPGADQQAVQYRQALMTVIDGTMSPLSLMQQGRMPYDAQLAGKHAADLAALGGMIREAFARNTGAARNANSAALPFVWSDPVAFADSAQRLEADAEALGAAVRAGRRAQVDAAIGRLASDCAQCHRTFRQN